MRKIYTLRHLLIMLLIACGTSMAFADTSLVVNMKSGAKHTYVLSDKPKITFEGTELSIVAPSAQTTLSLADVEKFYFDDTATGISTPAKGNSTFRYVDGELTVMGAEGTVTIVDSTGRTVYSSRGETVNFDMNTQPAGVYIVNMGKRSVKIMK